MNYLAKKSEIKDLITPSNVAEVLKKVSKAGRTKLVKWIIGKWTVQNIDDCFVTAAKAGKLEVVKFLHANGANIHVYNDLPIREASNGGHLHVVKFLHANGADIRADDDCAIIWASIGGHLDVVQFLHANGADIRAGNNSPIKRASRNGHLYVLQFLHVNGADILAVETYHKNVESYIIAEKWLQTEVSELKRNAAKVYVANYKALPEADTIPEEVMQILTAAKI